MGGLAREGAWQYAALEGGGASIVSARVRADGTDVVVPSVLGGSPVVRLERPFFASHLLTSVVVPDSVESIGEACFESCTHLEHVRLPSNIRAIPARCFKLDDALEQVDARGATTISSMAFFGCSSLRDVMFPHVTHVGDAAFHGCESLADVDLPECEHIGSRAFGRCVGLKNVHLPERLETIPSWAFHACSSLECVEAPMGLREVSGWAFCDCGSLCALRLDGAERIRGHAFARCESLETVCLASVKTIGSCAFRGCRSLRDVYLGKDVSSISDDAFRGASDTLTIHGGGMYTWWYCHENEIEWKS